MVLAILETLTGAVKVNLKVSVILRKLKLTRIKTSSVILGKLKLTQIKTSSVILRISKLIIKANKRILETLQ